MLKMKTGNLIDAAKAGEVTVIAHCCNCMCNMGGQVLPHKSNEHFLTHMQQT